MVIIGMMLGDSKNDECEGYREKKVHLHRSANDVTVIEERNIIFNYTYYCFGLIQSFVLLVVVFYLFGVPLFLIFSLFHIGRTV